MSVFVEIGMMVLIAMLLAFLVRLLKQPPIVAYIFAGIIMSSSGLITNKDLITAVSEIGIAFLLFTVGLELDFKKLRNIGGIAIGGGIMQFVILFALAFLISNMLGFSNSTSVYLSLVLAFSSTMIVVKILA